MFLFLISIRGCVAGCVGAVFDRANMVQLIKVRNKIIYSLHIHSLLNCCKVILYVKLFLVCFFFFLFFLSFFLFFVLGEIEIEWYFITVKKKLKKQD